MDYGREFNVPELTYRALVWLTYRLAATFAVGVPLTILIWAIIRKEASMIRLLSLYWKTSSLLLVSLLLLTDERPIGYLTSLIAPLLMVASVWFWVDLNEELTDLPTWRPLALTVKIWRWALSGVGVLMASISFISLDCIEASTGNNCIAWLEAPKHFHQVTYKLFNFLFGANWTEPLAAFVGYATLLVYLVGILQWLLIRLPRQGRIAGEF